MRTLRHAEVVQRAFGIARIDYGRADFGLVAGKVQIYEINTNPQVEMGREHPSPIRRESQALSWRRYLQALRDLDAPLEGSASAASIRISDERLTKYQTGGALLVRSRNAP